MSGRVVFPRPVQWLTAAGTDRDEWLRARRTGIGGSDVAAILGASPFSSPWDVWADKTDAVVAEVESERMMWGRLLEDVVARQWAAHLGDRRIRRLGMAADPVHPLRMASLDRAVLPPGSMRAESLLEVKTTSTRSGDLTDDELIDRYRTQCLWYLGVTGLRRAHVVVLVGGQRLVAGHVDADPGWYHDTGQRVEQWWADHVVTGVPPQLTALDLERVKGRAVNPFTTVLDADEQLQQWVAALRTVNAEIGELQERADALQAAVCDAMGGATELVGPDGNPIATWKPTTRTDIDRARLKAEQPDLYADYSNTTTGRRFHLPKPKKQKTTKGAAA